MHNSLTIELGRRLSKIIRAAACTLFRVVLLAAFGITPARAFADDVPPTLRLRAAAVANTTSAGTAEATAAAPRPFVFGDALRTGNSFVASVFAQDRYFLFGDHGIVLTSRDSRTWDVAVAAGVSKFERFVSWTGRKFVTVADRRVLTSDDGVAWSGGVSLPSTPHALTCSPAVCIAGGTTTNRMPSLLRSTDLANWTDTIAPGGTGEIADVVWSGKEFVAVGDTGSILRSVDGNEWTRVATSARLGAVTWSGGRFVALSSDYPGTQTGYTSVDGITWTEIVSPPAVSDLLWDGNRFVAVGAAALLGGENRGSVFESADGFSWTVVENTPPQLRAVANGPNGVVAAGDGGAVVRGRPWEVVAPLVRLARPEFAGRWIASEAFYYGRRLWESAGTGWRPVATDLPWAAAFLSRTAVGLAALATQPTTGANYRHLGLVTSIDGVRWSTPAPYPFANRAVQMRAFGDRVIAINWYDLPGGTHSEFATTTDGVHWQSSRPGAGPCFDIAYNGTLYVAVCNTGFEASVATSSDGVSWQNVSCLPDASGRDCDGGDPFGITWSGTEFIIVGSAPGGFGTRKGSRIWRTDAATYATLVPAGVERSLASVAASGSELVAVGDGGTVLRSLDGGATWNSENVRTSADLWYVAGSPSGFAITGLDGVLLWNPPAEQQQPNRRRAAAH